MIRLHLSRTVVLFAALTVGGFACTPEQTGTPCVAASDCGAAPDACVENTCVDKICGTSNRAAGTRVGTQTSGDCKASQCDGAGHTAIANDDLDLPVDSHDCTDDVCTGGVPSNPPRAAASACGAGGLLKCDGQGACVSCSVAADCGADTECQARICTAGVCGVNNVAAGTALAAQTAGDCKVSQCDGAGATTIANDDADVQADTTSCTSNVCTAGVPSNPPVAAGTVCSEGTGTLCDGAGACVACVTANDCAGTDDECHQRTCTAGVCGVAFTAINTPVASQTAHDCKKSVCDGAGAVTLANDNTDVPNDNNACTVDSCAAGVPTFADAAAGTSCGTAGVCTGGTCVGCNAPSDCPGTDDECKTRTCVSNVCGVTFTAANTPATMQTAHDCKKNACDGSGNIVNQNDNADLPADEGVECTDQVCTNGTPSFPPAAVNTACGTGGASFCNSGGSCVQCTAPTQCPGSDTECQARTCSSNVCGTSFTASGTVTAAQAPGDCKQNECDGAGNITAANHNADIPADDGNQCTTQACNAGAPVFPAAPVNTACGPGGGSFCNAAALCVGCNAPAQCLGSDTECHTRTCVSNVCGVNNVAVGTLTSSQTANDCHSNQCDGSGSIVPAVDNADLPVDDGNQCTTEVCAAGVPSHPNASPGTACNQGGNICSAGVCVACTAPSQCPGQDNECQIRTCTSNTCGFSFAASGTATASQTPGDCQQNQCNGAGAIASVANNSDVPADDGNQCTAQVCSGGNPTFPSVPVDTACNQGGGNVCSAIGTCVGCNAPTQCAGQDTECRSRTCAANTCGFSFAASGTLTSAQTTGDCQVNQCDGSGNIVTTTSSADLPFDGNQCTSDVCTAGVPSNPPLAVDAACNQGGTVCTGDGACVACNSPLQCPGSDTECRTRTCSSNTCGFSFVTSGTITSTQSVGDCQQNQCDGAGNLVSVANNTDLPVDNNQCTVDVCNAGAPTNPAASFGTACNQGGTICDGSGACVSPPQVASTTPADGAAVVGNPSISVTFTKAMNPATLTGQTTAGACTGSIQVSLDDFASCFAFSSAAAAMSGGNTATFTPAPGLLVNRGYKIRVTTAAADSSGLSLTAQFTQATGFTTSSPNLCGGSVVISQLFGGGGLTAGMPNADYIELHNRGTTAVIMTNWSVQYAGTTGVSWAVVSFSGTIQPGSYFLVRTQNTAGTGTSLPTPDAFGTAINMSGTVGKVALVSNTNALSGTCPTGVVDLVGYGAGTNCFEGTAVAPGPSNTTADFRVQLGCGEVNNNAADFATAAPNPRNSASAVATCACIAQNETPVILVEADYCDTQSPLSLSALTGTPTTLVYGRIYEAGMTDAASTAHANIRAQLGWGPASANPQYESGWTWTNASFNAGFVDASNDEYQASFTAPAVGSYRYLYRFSIDQGVSWTVCDKYAGDFGAGSNPGLFFNFADMPTLSVTP